MRLVFLIFLFVQVVRGTDWAPVRQWPAPEAHQAAAADAKFFYAITSRAVAKYDRTTGKRVALSTGAARHLNSGFFWKGKLLCAHSNYPFKPERSEIMVLDVDTMKLSTFKAFGNVGGSLVWVLRKDDHWWCNFAHYGASKPRRFSPSTTINGARWRAGHIRRKSSASWGVTVCPAAFGAGMSCG